MASGLEDPAGQIRSWRNCGLPAHAVITQDVICYNRICLLPERCRNSKRSNFGGCCKTLQKGEQQPFLLFEQK